MAAADFDRLASTLRDLHRALMERARRDYERERLTRLSPGELLERLTTDDAFAWLRELSELMADVDVVSESPADELDAIAGAIRPAVDHLLGAPGAPGAFAQRYWTHVHDDPHVAMAHAAVRQALRGFPAAPDGAPSAAHRRTLAERALARGRRPRA